MKVIKEIKDVKKFTKIPEGTYVDTDGDEYTIEYRYPNEFAIEMVVDGKPVVKVYMQYEGEWRVEDYTNGTIKLCASAKHAALAAFGTKKDWQFV